jgi:hypothetical protein
MAYTAVQVMVTVAEMMSVSERTVVVMVMESIAVVPIPVM